MRKVAYILSFGHTGSTLLSLFLEQHQQTVAIGEFNNFGEKIDRISSKRNCSCGEPMSDCPLWSDFHDFCKNNPPHNLQDEYDVLVKSVENNFDEEIIGEKGIGLENLTRRLALAYPKKHELMNSINHDIYTAKLRLEI